MKKFMDEGRTAHPEEPWLWVADWAARRVQPVEKPRSIIGFWVIAALVFGIIPLFPRSIQGEPFWPLGVFLWGLSLMDGFAGVAALILAVRKTLAWRRYGRVWLELETMPGILGGRFIAVLRTMEGFPSNARGFLLLTCTARGSTQTQRSYFRTLWQGSAEISAENGAIPVAFNPPSDMPESVPDIRDAEPWITWDLQVTVKSHGAPLTAQFRVPIFRARKGLEK